MRKQPHIPQTAMVVMVVVAVVAVVVVVVVVGSGGGTRLRERWNGRFGMVRPR
jgi:hypothetical protein